ncbi:MAG: sulfatase-like hydrolase/transferase [Sulfurospirillaceae bacterium]|nr:sulfatase-like hydrolase/transferase [Sulfurospirillaceae bacterium]
MYDDNLFDIVFNDFQKLSKSNKKFALFVSTMDTHHPYGHVSKGCKQNRYKDGSNSMLNAVICSDELISDFVKKIQNSSFGQNTIIVISSDHLAMHNMAINELEKGNRKNLFMVLDPRVEKGKEVEKKGTMLDVAPTILPFLGYSSDVGLGRDLISEMPSLSTTFPNLNRQLEAWTSDIAKFWEFPKIDKDLKFNTKSKTLKISNQRYSYPILLKLNDALEVMPFFEIQFKLFDATTLSGHLLGFEDNDAFIWIDKCSKLEKIEDKIKTKERFCYVCGKLGGEIAYGVVSKNSTVELASLKELSAKDSIDENLSTSRREVLQSMTK